MRITSQKKVYPPVDRCIYCGRADDLSDEHIIPWALAGDTFVLPRSSCPACATRTGRAEGLVSRMMLGDLRVALDMPTRRSKDRRAQKSKLPVLVVGGPGAPSKSVRLSRDEAPIVYPAMILPRPGLLIGRSPRVTVEVEFKSIDYGVRLPQLGEKFGDYLVSKVPVPAFLQMLAKIGHAYALAERGCDAFNALLLDVILSNEMTELKAFQLIGGADDPEEEHNKLHKLGLSERYPATGGRYLVATIQLFNFLGAPTYDVIVGDIP